jgi:hypothetical protein
VKFIEHQHQAALVAWAHRTRLPAAADVRPGATLGTYLLALPMGGKRNPREAARLKAEGAKPGVSDLLLPLRRQGFGSFWLEMKAPGKKPTPAQREWLELMREAGYRAEWHDSWTEAAAALADYVGVQAPIPTIAAPVQRRAA